MIFFLYWLEWTMTFTLFFSVHVLDEEQVFPDVWWLYSWRVINRLVGKSPLSVDAGLCIRHRIRAAGGGGGGGVDARPCACSQSSDQISCWPSTNNRRKKLKPKEPERCHLFFSLLRNSVNKWYISCLNYLLNKIRNYKIKALVETNSESKGNI